MTLLYRPNTTRDRVLTGARRAALLWHRRVGLALVLAGAALLAGAPAHAVDHNNIDAGRPLAFDDAEPIARHEQDLDLGLRFGVPRRRPLRFGLDWDYLFGFGPNSHLSVGLSPSVGGQSGSGVDFGNLSLGVQHQFNREIKNTPAFALRADAYLPTGRNAEGPDFRLRGIWSKTVGQYNRLHLNLDLNAASRPRHGERQFNPGLILGYTKPLGYPKRFDRTGLASLGIQAGPKSGAGPIVTFGLGVRQQVTVRSVVDVGIESDVAAFNGAPGDSIRFIAGYSTAF